MHARSTGPYSLVTQQPLGGKAQMGGQRLGEMEVWAFEAHRAAYALQEMLTIKSDDVTGRAKTFEAIVKGTEIPAPTVPESFRVLMRELNSLGLDIVMYESQEQEDETASPGVGGQLADEAEILEGDELPKDEDEDAEVADVEVKDDEGKVSETEEATADPTVELPEAVVEEVSLQGSDSEDDDAEDEVEESVLDEMSKEE